MRHVGSFAKASDSGENTKTPPPVSRERTKFVADAMLGSLARKLRVLGFDTAYYKSGDDSGIIRLAAESGRVILTADRALGALAARRGVNAVVLTGRSDGSRVKALVKTARLAGFSLHKGDPLCSLCNGELERLGRDDVAGKVPRSVEARHRLFYECRSCGKVYWKGGHWKKLRSFERMLEEA